MAKIASKKFAATIGLFFLTVRSGFNRFLLH